MTAAISIVQILLIGIAIGIVASLLVALWINRRK